MKTITGKTTAWLTEYGDPECLTNENKIALDTLKDLVNFAESQICQHEETKRGGAIWEICCQCGSKWADDRGGKPPYVEPIQLTNAYKAIATLEAVQVEPDFERECDDTDKLLRMVGLNAVLCRTEGGSLNLPKIKDLLFPEGDTSLYRVHLYSCEKEAEDGGKCCTHWCGNQSDCMVTLRKTPDLAEAVQVEPVAPHIHWTKLVEWWEKDRDQWDELKSIVTTMLSETTPQEAAPTGWQPIATAPKDGYMLVHEDTAIRALLRIKGVWHPVGYPALVLEPWGDVVVGEDAKRLLSPKAHLELLDGCCDNPTHWMPIPAAPKAAS